jgi:cytochrome c-type biogenesis protein CcmH/NrfG
VVTRLASVVVDAVAALTSARNRYTENDLDGSLSDYESLVRSNQNLEDVVTDLTKAVEKHKGNPAVYRVLGDGLMRQGKLQAALDTYRKALNQL